MTTQVIQTTMKEDFTRYEGIFGVEMYTYARLLYTHNDRYIVVLGDSSRPSYAFTYRSQALAFLTEQNVLGKAALIEHLKTSTTPTP